MVPKACLQCEAPLPMDTIGRGGKQPSRKFCSRPCQVTHKNNSRKNLATVACNLCGKARQLLHPHRAGDMCRTCAAKIGTEKAIEVNTQDRETRFMRYVSVNPNTGCWDWTGTKQSNGYSTFTQEGARFRGHRWSYEHFVGLIPESLQIDHLCRNRGCVNPRHLEPVTAAENARRAMRSECVNGHAFTPENTYMHGGKRYCRECRRSRNRARQQSR